MQVILMLTLLVLFIFFILCPTAVLTAAQCGLHLWWDTLVPALLPFFILNDLLARTGCLQQIGRLLKKPLYRLFRLPGETALLFLAGYSTGAPVAAGLVSNLRRNNLISRNQANILLPATANVSPGFILSAVAVSMLHAEACGRTILLVCYGSNILLATVLFLRSRGGRHPNQPPLPLQKAAPLNAESLRQALFHSCKTMVFIGGTVMLSYILLTFFIETGIFTACASLLPFPGNELLTPLSGGILEITAGSQMISDIELPLTLKLPLLTAILSFGGLSAALQIKNEIRDTDISIGCYLLYKIIQGAVAFTISLLILEIPHPVWTGTEQAVTMSWHQQLFPFILPGFYLIFSVISLLFRFLWGGEH